MSLSRYAVVVGGSAAGSLALFWPVLARALDVAGLRAVVLAATLAAANSVAAYGLVRWSAGRSHRTFMKAVLGGMLVRMALMLAAVVAALAWLDLPRAPLAFALLAYFVVFLVLELALVARAPASPAPVGR